MKKIFTLAAAVIIAAGAAFAQQQEESLELQMTLNKLDAADSYADTKTRTIQIEDKYAYLHPKAKNVTLQLEFTPLTGEVIFTYTCMQSSFEVGEAMNVGMAVYEDFAAENQFKHYKYVEKDKKKFFKDEKGVRMATYTSKVIFTK
ncbi:hypothetical protein [Treponema sp.]|uniref:hypothetical protein n=1 Tax=Treponema sp. TaxID=166 RepID=UPI003EFC3CF1